MRDKATEQRIKCTKIIKNYPEGIVELTIQQQTLDMGGTTLKMLHLPSWLILALHSLQVEAAHASCSSIVVFYLWLWARLVGMTLTISKIATNKGNYQDMT